MQRTKQILFPIITMGLTILLIVVALELVLRLLPVNDPPPLAVELEEPTFPHFVPNRDFVYSKGWDMGINNRGRTNNYGFVNARDYDAAETGPLLAVIGDSFIEAFMVPFDQSVSGRLGRAMGNDVRVYSFAMSGAPLSQYLLWARNACEMFKPDALYISIVGNDFDESFAEYKLARGGGPLAPFTYFAGARLDAFSYQTERFSATPAHPTRMHELASRMGLGRLALTRYVRTNYPGLDRALAESIGAIMPGDRDETGEGVAKTVEFVGNVEASLPERRIQLSELAVRFFFRELAKIPCVAPETIVFSVDGMRQSIYDPADEPAARSSYFGKMRDYFLEQATAQGYEVVDLHEVFRKDYADHGKRFEFRTDGHWNGYGHGVVTEELLRREPIRRLIEGPPEG